MRLLAFLARLLGLIGLLLCLGGIAGTFWTKGKVVGVLDTSHAAVDGLLEGAQESVADALPRIRAARKHLAVKAAELTLPEIAHLRARLEAVARAGESASDVLHALGRDGVKVAELRARIGQLREAARDLTDRPQKREPALARAEEFLDGIHGNLSDFRLGTAALRNRAERIIGIGALALAGFFFWMGLGQACLVRGRREA